MEKYLGLVVWQSTANNLHYRRGSDHRDPKLMSNQLHHSEQDQRIRYYVGLYYTCLVPR